MTLLEVVPLTNSYHSSLIIAIVYFFPIEEQTGSYRIARQLSEKESSNNCFLNTFNYIANIFV